MTQMLNDADFRKCLMRWYARGHRKLPWRQLPGQKADGYRVLVSEAMLQQTQVATVVDYYRRFMRRFPTLAALAAADRQQVLRAWQGLGYYRRAIHLHRLAQKVVDEYNGRLPDSVEQLIALPGIGRYTAGAIASIAFGRRAAVVDGNVMRVLVRLEAVDEPIDRPAVQRRMWERAEVLLPRRSRTYTPGDFNQAMMELGATVCTPRAPRCGACPVRRFCEAHRRGIVEQLPVRGSGPRVRPVYWVVLAVRRRGCHLFEQRDETGLWSGMWQLLSMEDAPHKPQVAQWCADRTGLRIDRPRQIGRFVHHTTHRRIHFDVYEATAEGGRLKRGAGRWRRLDALDDLPLPRPQQKIVTLLRQ